MPPVYSESYWKRREEADEERERLANKPVQGTSGLRMPGNIDLNNRPSVIDPANGKTATVRSMNFGTDEGEMLIPTVSDDGRIMGDEEAMDYSRKSGKHLGIFETPEDAERAAAEIHEDQDRLYGDREDVGTTPPAPVAPPADDGMKAQRLKAIERMRTLSETPYEPPEGLRDSDIAAASQRDREQVRRDNFTEALAAAFARRPARMQSLPSESASLAQRRAAADANAARKSGLEMSANARLAAALKGETPKGGLTEYQREQLKRADADDAYRKEKDTKKAESDAAALSAGRKSWAPVLREMGIDPETATQKDIDRAMQRDSSLATRELARSQFGYKKERDVEEDTKDLSKSIGGDPGHLEGLLGRLDTAAAKPDVPGVGPLDRNVPDIMASPEALQARNDMREAVRTMLTMKSGKTVTPQEAQDYARIYGIDGSEEAFRQGVKRLRADVADTMRAKKAGFRPDVVERYEGAGGAPTPKRPDSPATEKPPPGAIPPNATNVKRFGKGWAYTLPDGSQELWEP